MRPTIYDRDHEAAEHFGRLGYEALAATCEGPPDEWEDDLPRQRRCVDEQVLAALRRGWPEKAKKPRKRGDDSPREKPVQFAGHLLDWHLALPEIKTWAAQMSLETVIGERVAAIRAHSLPAGVRLVDWTLPLNSASGLDGRVALDALDLGFSLAGTGTPVETWCALELLAAVGMQIGPLARLARKKYGYQDSRGQWWHFAVEMRDGGYHRRLGRSSRLRLTQ